MKPESNGRRMVAFYRQTLDFYLASLYNGCVGWLSAFVCETSPALDRQATIVDGPDDRSLAPYSRKSSIL